MTDDLSPREARAAEYVLGTLRGGDRRRFESEAAGDAELRALVAHWEDRLLGLTESIEPVAPSPTVWAGIEQAMAETARPRPKPSAADRIWNSLTLWRAATVLGAAAAVLLAIIAVRTPEPAPTLVAVLTANDGPAFAVRVPTADQASVTPVGEREPPAGKSFELWLVPDQAAPVSLGLVTGQEVTRLPVERAPAAPLREGAVLAVSLEPEGGSPTGQPTGPILFTGTLVEAM